MNKTQYKKIILGSVRKARQHASMYGEICMMDLDLVDIILSLAFECQLSLDYDTQKCLEKMARDIMNKNKNICQYRDKKINDKKFIN